MFKKEDCVMDGSCNTVSVVFEKDFYNSFYYHTQIRNHYEQISGKKTRPMTNDEMRGFIANTPGIEVKRKGWGDNFWSAYPSFEYEDSPENWLYRTITLSGETGEPQKFVVKE